MGAAETQMTLTVSPVAGRRMWLWPGMFATLLVTLGLLRGEGRLWLCACGRLSVWAGNICSADNSQQFFDPYSFTHLLHGFLYCWLLAWLAPRLTAQWQLWLAVAVEALWEVCENSSFVIQRYREATAALGYQGDTIVNSIGDILSCALGFMLARRLGFRRSLALFVAVEVVLLYWIRDSLMLEILILLHPVNAIRAWQLCP